MQGKMKENQLKDTAKYMQALYKAVTNLCKV
jgi:hypothetical protein